MLLNLLQLLGRVVRLEPVHLYDVVELIVDNRDDALVIRTGLGSSLSLRLLLIPLRLVALGLLP